MATPNAMFFKQPQVNLGQVPQIRPLQWIDSKNLAVPIDPSMYVTPTVAGSKAMTEGLSSIGKSLLGAVTQARQFAQQDRQLDMADSKFNWEKQKYEEMLPYEKRKMEATINNLNSKYAEQAMQIENQKRALEYDKKIAEMQSRLNAALANNASQETINKIRNEYHRLQIERLKDANTSSSEPNIWDVVNYNPDRR